jgi:hypothetical protein
MQPIRQAIAKIAAKPDWYLSPGTNFVLCGLEIGLFLTCVGSKSGPAVHGRFDLRQRVY